MSRPRNDTPIARPVEDKDTFTGFSDVLATSAAFGVLTPVEWRIYTSLMIRHNGHNNGQIVLSVAQIVDETTICRQKVMPSLHRLEELGLIVRRYMGQLLKDKNSKISKASAGLASEWEITDYHTWDKPMGKEDRKKIPAARTFADWCPTTKKIVPGSRSKSLPKPGAGATIGPSKPRPSRQSPVKRPASLSTRKPAPNAASRSQHSEPAIPEPASPVSPTPPVARSSGRRVYEIDEIRRDDAIWQARHGTPRPPVQDTRGNWFYRSQPIPEAQAEALIDEDVPF